MIPAIETLAQQLRHDVRALAVVSQNIANQATIGYRAARLVPDFANGVGLTTAVSLQPGPLQETGRALDLAIDGAGFFAIGSDQGLLLSRAGQFRRSAEGQLVDHAGRAVLGENGPLELGLGAIRIAGNGDVFEDGQAIGRLLVLQPAPGVALLPIEGGLRPLGAAIESPASRIRQGALEGANVDSAQETIALIALTRHVESVQRALSIYDQTLDTGINRLGEN